jgi:hypothetical protein
MSKAIEDRDYFSQLVDKKEEKLNDLNGKINNYINNISHVYEGKDDYGVFYDVYNMSGYPKHLVNKLQDINDELESGQFAYYTYNNHSDREGLEINDISIVGEYFDRVKKHKLTNGKYNIFIIFNNRVYPFKIH